MFPFVLATLQQSVVLTRGRANLLPYIFLFFLGCYIYNLIAKSLNRKWSYL